MASSEVWHLRVDKEDKKQFDKRAVELGVTSNNMGRELVKAFAEDRIKIIPTTEDKKKGEIYVTGK